MISALSSYYTGTSGLVLPVPNKTYYPEEYQNKSRLTYYASLSNSIEVNSSFYRIPRAATLQKWSEEVPEGFRFSFKLFKEITHSKALAFHPQDIITFFDQLTGVGSKRGALLIQLPPSIRIQQLPGIGNLLSVIREIDHDGSWPLALECRHASLYHEDLQGLLEDVNCSLVVHDKTGAVSPLDWDSGSIAYLRFHGPSGDYRGTYDDAFLSEYAGYIREWLLAGKTVYTYFNNTMGNAHRNMVTLRNEVAQD